MGLPNSVISAPAMNVRPSQMSTAACSSGSAFSAFTPSTSATRTVAPMAFTGGLLMRMTPMLPCFSKLPLMGNSVERVAEGLSLKS